MLVYFHGVELLGILKYIFLKVAKMKEAKVKNRNGVIFPSMDNELIGDGNEYLIIILINQISEKNCIHIPLIFFTSHIFNNPSIKSIYHEFL